MVSANYPLRTPDGRTRNAALEQNGDQVVPKQPLSDVTIPTQLSDGAQLQDGNVGVDIAGAQPSDPNSSLISTDGSAAEKEAAFYPEVLTDTDVVMAPALGGLETMFQLRSRQSPEQLTMHIDVPPGGKLVAAADGGAKVLDGDGKQAALITPPLATDAQGTNVPVTMAVSGSDAVIDVAHQKANLAYPILVDPIVQPTVGFFYNSSANWDQWIWNSNYSFYAPYTNCQSNVPYSCEVGYYGRFIHTWAGYWYQAGTYGQWGWTVPGGPSSYISSAYIYQFRYYTAGGTLNPYAYVGLWGPAPGWVGYQSMLYNGYYGGYGINGGPGVRSLIGGMASGSGTLQSNGWRFARLSAESVTLDDGEAPSITPPVPVSPTPALSNWLPGGAAGTVTVDSTSTDAGLGVRSTNLTVPQQTGPAQVLTNDATSLCSGLATSPCPSSRTDRYTFNTPAAPLPDGINQVVATSKDAIGYQTDTPFDVRVDRTGPQVALSGALATAANGDIAGDSYALHVAATDGTTDPSDPPQTHRSGVKNIQVYVDDHAQQVTTADQSCPQDSCPLELDYTLDTIQLSAGGTHTVTIVATDELGNPTTKTITLHTYPGAILTPKAGDTTAERFSLVAQRHNAAYDQVTFQFRRADTDPWTSIPTANLTQGGQAVTWPAALGADGKNQELSWDVPSTPGIDGADGPIQLRASFAISGAHTEQDYSQIITTTLNRDTTTSKHASAPVGPGTVDLLTGNFSVSTDDVSLNSFGSDLTVSRTFASRQPALNPSGVYGPGWIASNPVDAASSDYTSLVFSDQIAKLTESDSTTITFSRNGSGDFTPEPGYEDLTLAASGSTYTVSDLDGNVTTFSQQASGGSDYRPTSVQQPGSQNKTTNTWETVNGQTRVNREIAPIPASVNCPASGALNPGCRALDFTYATATTATGNSTNSSQWGDFTGRLKDITFNDGPDHIVVAHYQYDSDGRLRAEWDPRISPNLITTYDYNTDGRIAHITPPGENQWTLAYRPAPPANPPPSDPSGGRLASVSRSTPTGTATTNVAYGIPLTGSGTPYQMGSADVSAWAQTDVPTDATAILPADVSSVSDPPSSSQLQHATVSYMNRNGDQVNVAQPGGEISTTEYEDHRQVRRTLSPGNRARALADSNPAQLAAKLDNQNIYGADGLELREQYGPMHQVKLADDSLANAREHTVTTFDQGAPAIQHPHLPTTAATGVRVDGQAADVEVRTSTTAYDWKLRQPTAVTTDPSGLALTSRTSYDSSTGLPIEARTPSAGASGDNAHVTKTIYYTAGANASDSSCASKPLWANLPCKTLPAAQPGGLAPNLPTTKIDSYNVWNQPTSTTDSVPSSGQQRTTITGYDGAGRLTSTSVSASGANVGTALPTASNTYSTTTGRLLTTSTIEGATTRTITRAYDAIGRPTSYTDADGITSLTTYDILNRPVTKYDGKGTSTFIYDGTTRRLSGLNDSAAGGLTASYDADGNVTGETIPAGANTLSVNLAYDAAGNLTSKAYTNCPIDNCSGPPAILFADAAYFSGQDQLRSETTTGVNPRTDNYQYDTAGRLTRSNDQPAGGPCTVRWYGYDANSNRSTSSSVPSAANQPCDTSNASKTSHQLVHNYDSADRLTDSGYTYDAFGRTLNVPSADSGGSALGATYYVDDTVRSLTQAGVTQTFNSDPIGRVRLQSTTGQTDQTAHYSDASDNPSWIDLGGSQANWRRFIGDPSGNLAATQAGHGPTSDGFTYQLTDLHGDVVATANSGGNISQTFATDEFGIPTGAVPADGHGWVGGKGRQTQLASGAITMGKRVYVPQIGRFLQTDPLAGGSANDYDYVNQDPLDQLDLAGTRPAGRAAAHSIASIARSMHSGLPSLSAITGVFQSLVSVVAKATAIQLKTSSVGKLYVALQLLYSKAIKSARHPVACAYSLAIYVAGGTVAALGVGTGQPELIVAGGQAVLFGAGAAGSNC